MWSLLKIFGVVGGISIVLCVGVLYAARQAPPQNQWLVYETHDNAYATNSKVYSMQPDGSQIQAIHALEQTGSSRLHHDKQIICDYTTFKFYWATQRGRLLTPLFNLSCNDYFSFSPDEKWVYMIERKSDDGATLYRIHMDGSGRQNVYSDPDDSGLSIAGWSPNQDWVYLRIARSSDEVDAQLARMRPDGSDFQMLIEERTFTSIAAWSPDHEWLILDSYGYGLSRMRPDGSQLEKIASGMESTWLGWTPDHQNVLFAAQNQLWTMNWATGERRLLSPYKLPDFERPQLSPDGQWILYRTYSEEVWDYTGDLGSDWRLVRIDGWRDIRLTVDPNSEHTPVWSPDGQWLYFGVTSHGHAAPSMYRIRLDGTGRQLLVHSASPLRWQETPNLHWRPTHLSLIGLVTWGIGTFAPFLRRQKSSSAL